MNRPDDHSDDSADERADDRPPEHPPEAGAPQSGEADPRVTAYVLGELSADEAREFEVRLEQDAELRTQVDSLRALAGELQDAFADSDAPLLDPARRRTVESGWQPRSGTLHRWRFAAAAAVVLFLTGWWLGDFAGSDPDPAPSLSAGRDPASADGTQDASRPESLGIPTPEGDRFFFDANGRQGRRGEGGLEEAEQRRLAEMGYLLEDDSREEFGLSPGDFERLQQNLGDPQAADDPDRRTQLRTLGYLGSDVDLPALTEAGVNLEPLEAASVAHGGPGGSYRGPGDVVPGSDRSLEREKAGDLTQDATSSATWKPSVLPANSSRLMVGDDDALPLESSQVQVLVEGFRARVVIDAYYRNDRGRQLEGNFQLRLPEGASPDFLAFGESVIEGGKDVLAGDVFFSAEQVASLRTDPAGLMADRAPTWRAPREARIVPREKANRAYHDTVRRRIDPALMEWSGAGVFRTRVFPLLPGKLHRITVGYEVDLQSLQDGSFELRLDLPREGRAVALDLRVRRDEDCEFTLDPPAEWFENEADVHLHLRDPETRAYRLRLHPRRAPMLRGEDEQLGVFFATVVRPQLPMDESPALEPRPAVLAVDTSLSASPEKFALFAELAPRILAMNEDAIPRFAVLFFDVEARWWRPQWTENTAEAREALVAALDTVDLEGATDLGLGLRHAARPGFAAEDAREGAADAGAGERAAHDVFLLSDGASTWGEANLDVISQALRSGRVHRLHGYRTGLPGTDLRSLQSLARDHGGAVFHLPNLEALDAAAAAWREEPWRLLSCTAEGSSDVLIEGAPTVIQPGQPLVIAGRGTPGDSGIVLRLQRGSQEHEVVIDQTWAVDSELAARRYGQLAVELLETAARDGEADAERRAYATHFRVPGQTCSLLMLDSEADYERYEIRPEEDAFLIGRRPVGAALDGARARRSAELDSAKARLLRWIERREEGSGLRFELSEPFRQVMADLSPACFEIAPEELRTQDLGLEGAPGKLGDQLAARRTDYDLLCEEAERRRQSRGPADALKALSSLVENEPGNANLLRDVAGTAQTWGLPGAAYGLLRRVVESRPHEPQTYWNLAQCLERMGRPELAMVWFELALEGPWDARFGEFRRIAATDYLRFLRGVERGESPCEAADWVALRRQRLQDELGFAEADVVVILQWNTDRTDVDLHVFEPPPPGGTQGEHCYYSHRQTRIGGQLSTDVTQGYGPEMYVLKDKPKGPMHLQVHYFAVDPQRTGVRSKVHAFVHRNWGRPEESVESLTVTLEAGKQQMNLTRID